MLLLIGIGAVIVLIAITLIILNENYYMLACCRRVKTVDGSPLESKVAVIRGKTIFGNNFDLLAATPEKAYNFARQNAKKAQGKSYLLNFFSSPILTITNAEDAEEVLQSQALITKSFIYELLMPFLGLGLLVSTDDQWHFRRKLLTPAFHFNILLTFLEVFKEESHKFIAVLKQKTDEIVTLGDVVSAFTLNNICETALGVKLDELPGSELYRKSVVELEPLIVNRVCNPMLHFDWTYRLTNNYKKQTELLKIIHDFSSKVVQKKRVEYRQRNEHSVKLENFDDFGKKRRYAMLDTLLDAESQGLIDHQGICDEVNTFMFEGFDTTSSCLMFTIFNLATYSEVQQKCFEEVQNLADADDLSLFDFNKLEYLECVIKETLRLYPSVPFFGRNVVKETIVNGLVFPPNAEIHLHLVDIMRDERHYPEPLKFKPERFHAKNTTNRNPFAFMPFSAGPRNCIGQKFAMLEVKVLLVAILKKFRIEPVTQLKDLTFENGLVLRTKEKLNVKFVYRK